MQRQQILIVEDDLQLAQAIEGELCKTYATRVAGTGRDALFLAETESFDLILLDLNLPDIDGITVAQELRRNEAEVLMVTARADVKSRVAGLYAGASDYLAKPFDMHELVARVFARLRDRSPLQTICYGNLELVPENCICTVAGTPVTLTALEFRLLSLLLANQGRVFSKDDIEDRLYQGEGPNSNTVEALISKVRRKLSRAGAGEPIQTIRGFGYVIR
ncbi:MAG: response regulator transcription factor [Trueperaceae bacterium]